MAILTKQHIYRPQHSNDLPALRALGLTDAPAGFPLTVLHRKTRDVCGCVWREIVSDANHRFQEERLTALAGSAQDESRFLQDVRRSQLQPKGEITPQTRSLADSAIRAFRAAFPAAITSHDGFTLQLPTGTGCQLLLRADALPTGLALTAGLCPMQPMLPAGPMLRGLLTLRLCRFADSTEEICAFAEDAQMLYTSMRNADKKTLKAAQAARQKEYLQHISAALTPLGFRKKAMTWTLPVSADASVVFEVQPHRFGDQLFLNLYAQGKGTRPSAPIRLEQELDWQQLSAEDVHDLMQMYIAEDILPLITHLQGG